MEVLIILAILVAPFVIIYVSERRLRTQIQGVANDLGIIITKHFLTQSCSQCCELEMRLLTVSPNARSIQYLCRHCQKKQYAAATSPDAFGAAAKYERLQALICEFNRRYGRNKPIRISIVFHTPEAP